MDEEELKKLQDEVKLNKEEMEKAKQMIQTLEEEKKQLKEDIKNIQKQPEKELGFKELAKIFMEGLE